MHTPPRIRLATTLSTAHGRTIVLGDEVTPTEADEAATLMRPLAALHEMPGSHRTQTAWEELTQAVAKLPGLPASRELDARILSKVVAYISAFRTYLNLQEAFWKRTYPKQWPAVEQATRAEFDRPDKSYALVFHLRNYTEHVSTAGISIDRRLNPRTGEASARIIVHRDTLVTQYERWQKTVLRTLQSSPDTFDLMPVLTESMQGLSRINDTAANSLLLLAKDSIEGLRSWANRAPTPDGDAGEPSLVWENINFSKVVDGETLSIKSTPLMSHRAIDRLEIALGQPDPLMAARQAFNGEISF